MSEKLNFKNFNKSIKENEMKIMKYYNRNFNKQQPVTKPNKQRKLTRKQMKEYSSSQITEKLTKTAIIPHSEPKKQIVIMDD